MLLSASAREFITDALITGSKWSADYADCAKGGTDYARPILLVRRTFVYARAKDRDKNNLKVE
jgi:hypothetical protein